MTAHEPSDSPTPPSIVPKTRVLLGPGPSEIHPAVLRAMGQPTVGHLDPGVLAAQDELRAMLATIYGASPAAGTTALAISATGTGAMEAALVNAIEPGAAALIVAHGYFGERMADMARRLGADVTLVAGEWGRATDPAAVASAARGKRFAILGAVHAETSTGVLADPAPLAAIARECGALFLLDCVTSLGCVPVDFERHGVDFAYSCAQKGLSCPPGSSPLAVSARAREAIGSRKHRPSSFYFDLALLLNYWEGARAYHHTASSNQLFALHEACRLVLDEGLDARFARHRAISQSCADGLEALGLELVVDVRERLPQLLAVRIPDGVDDARVRARLLGEFGIEIGGGLGAFKGKVWRIGLMGAGAIPRNVLLLLGALEACLRGEGFKPRGSGIAAASTTL
jgi:alanine-glyoxylate transaminase/serine-glyoxylate transaminase/serine-pyruvate transaminase